MAMKQNKNELKRINVNLPINLVKRVEDYALEKGYNVTNAYIALLNIALDNYDGMKAMPYLSQLTDALKGLTSEQNQDVDNLIDYLSSKKKGDEKD